jgi:gamma-glutamylcyclotransferase (GGCT)/AIG2-like uncharacterized protein YtfP
MHRVFVYGTLKRGIHNHHLLKSSQYLGEAYTVDPFKMFNVGFPVIRFDDNGLSVHGEVYDVDDETLKKLDGLENEGVMYDRKEIPVVFPGGQPVDLIDTASVYIGNDEYWDRHLPAPYEILNEYGELDWQP